MGYILKDERVRGSTRSGDLKSWAAKPSTIPLFVRPDFAFEMSKVFWEMEEELRTLYPGLPLPEWRDTTVVLEKK